MKILLLIRFIGTAYCGFQCQKNGIAVQNVLTEAAKKVYSTDCLVTGCSRTDAGVHALGFTATVETVPDGDAVMKIPAGRVHHAFRAFLPDDISVIGATFVPDSFHPRYSAAGKNYIYRIRDARSEDPFDVGRTGRVYCRIENERLEKVKRAAYHFVGKHDFKSFMASGSSVSDTVRTVTEAEVYRESDSVCVFSVSADGFLYNMVRIMAGTLMDVAAGRISPDDIPAVIESGERKNAGVTAPPEGLYLNKVIYPDEIEWRCD